MTRLLALAALFALLGAPAVAAQVSQITVTADGHSSAVPDMATANLAISTSADTAAQATSDNNARYARLLQALQPLGIGKNDVQTGSFNLSYNPPPRPPEVPPQGQRYGYSVYRSVSVTVHRVSAVGQVVDAAVASGVTDVNGVSFDTSDSEGQFARALRDAVQIAQRHAQAMAASAGLRILRVRSMQEGFTARPLPMMQEAVFRAAPNAMPTQIQPSAVQTTATVTITYDAQ